MKITITIYTGGGEPKPVAMKHSPKLLRLSRRSIAKTKRDLEKWRMQVRKQCLC